jgi:hypothetical protein
MKIIVKKLLNINQVYLFDYTMRPLFIDLVSNNKTKKRIKELVLKYDIIDIIFTKEINFSD